METTAASAIKQVGTQGRERKGKAGKQCGKDTDCGWVAPQPPPSKGFSRS